MGRQAGVLLERWQALRARITAAAVDAGRDPATVRLLSVSKGHPVASMVELARAGQGEFGESFVQEAIAKQDAWPLACGQPVWHFLGRVQSNKTRLIAERFAWVHSLFDLRHAGRLSEQRPEGARPLQVLLEVNLDGESSKGGVAVEAAPALARAVAVLPRLELRGLMCIPAPREDAAAQRAVFARLAALRDACEQALGRALPELSMGMSDDFEAAIAAGSTWVRIGTALFGERPARGPTITGAG